MPPTSTASISLQVKSNYAQVIKQMKRAKRQQIPFATAVALTRTAKDAQQDVKRALPRRFAIRSQWVPGGIRIKPARKSDWPDITALIGSRDEFMVLQETGGTKRPKKSKTIAIPTKFVRGGRRGKITKAKRPRALLRKDNITIFGDGSKGGRIVQRYKAKSRAPKTLYFLRKQASIKPRFEFEDTVELSVRRNYNGHFIRELNRAVRASR